MPTEAITDPKFEIGHVLFIDVVGYSKLNIDEQSRLSGELNRIVQGTERFQRAEAERKLICLPTGDGMALVFRDSAESPAQCALETSAALRNHGQIALRMGIHSGPVNEVNDVNNRTNLAGAGKSSLRSHRKTESHSKSHLSSQCLRLIMLVFGP